MAVIASAGKFTIGQTTTITIKYETSTEVLTTLEWVSGSQAGTINLVFTGTTVNFAVPTSLYNEIPNQKTGTIVFYLNSTKGTNIYPYTLHTDASQCTPTISLPSVQEGNDAAFALTGDRSKLIRYISTANVTINANARNGATISDLKTTNKGALYITDSFAVNNIDSSVFYIEATDSRGYATYITYTIPAERVVEYIKLTCNAGNERPDTSGDLRLTCSGNYFNASFGAVNNTLTVEYRYKEQGGEFGAWQPMTATPSKNTYTAFADLSGLDYKTTYVFECRATDKAMTITSAEKGTQALPVFHWSGTDFVHETPVDFRQGFMINGEKSDVIVEQGTTGSWTYRKWESGFAECWGRITKSVSGSDWTTWGSLYQATILMNEDYPLTFTSLPTEIATLHSLSGGMLNSSAMGMSSTTTGAHFAVHPNKLSSTYGFVIELYVTGKWK